MNDKPSSGPIPSTPISPAPAIGLRELLDAAPDVIFCCDARGRFQWLSAATESLLGPRPGELLGRPFTTLLAPAERARIGWRLARQSRSRDGEIGENVTLTGPDGRKVRVAIRARRIARPHGESIFVGTARTLPAAGTPGAAGAPSSEEVQELAAQLEEARATVQQKTDFLAMMSHEIRTPMNGVMGMTHLLLESKLDRDQLQLVEVIQSSARALITLINDTLDYSRLEAGKLPLESIDFDLRVTVEEVAQLMVPLAHDKSLGFGCIVHHEVPSRLKGDPSRLRQVLVNFMGNAIKFTEQGEVSILVERMEEDDDGVELRFSVRDTGIGMTPEQARRIFDPYVQADASTARRFGGSGLGLAISHQLVQLMGGTVGVESDPGKGSTFWFKLPFEKQPAASPVPRQQSVQLRGLRVLVVDPSSAVRQSLVEMLSAWGCRADQAEHCEDALPRMREAVARGQPYNVALIEIEQPGMDGEQLGWTVRSDDKLATTLTMLMTTVGRRGDAARAQMLGFSAYLVKPVQWGELYAAMVEVVGNATEVAEGATPLVTRHTLAEARRRRMRVLLVEDNAVNQMVADWALRRLGFTIDKAGDATQALELVEQQKYDLILMDIQMPGMDGYRAATAIRARERGGPRVPIIAMTGNVGPGERERCVAAGMDDYLAKPIDLAQLCATVEHWTHEAPEGTALAPAAAGAPSPPAPATPESRRAGAGTATPSAMAGKPRGTQRTAPKKGGAEEPSKLAADDATKPAVTPTHAEFAGPYAAVSNQNTGVPARPEPAAEPGAESGGEPLVAIDTARLEEASMGIPALRNSLLQTFLSDVHPRLARLREAVSASDPRRVEFEAHGLKGMCRTIGAAACGEVFWQLEQMGEEASLARAPAALERAEHEVARTEEYIRRLDQILRKAA